jgi:hypothetical protein
LKYGQEEEEDDDDEEEEMEAEEEEEEEEEEEKKEEKRKNQRTLSPSASATAEEKHTAPVTSAASSLPCDSEPRGEEVEGREGGEGGEGERESEEAREARRQLLRERDEGDPDGWRHVALKERWPSGRVRTFDRLNRLLAQVRDETGGGAGGSCTLALPERRMGERERQREREIGRRKGWRDRKNGEIEGQKGTEMRR